MLLIRGIYLLLSHSPTSHTTVRAVPHTAVQLIRWSPCTVLRSETSPILAKYNVGTA